MPPHRFGVGVKAFRATLHQDRLSEEYRAVHRDLCDLTAGRLIGVLGGNKLIGIDVEADIGRLALALTVFAHQVTGPTGLDRPRQTDKQRDGAPDHGSINGVQVPEA